MRSSSSKPRRRPPCSRFGHIRRVLNQEFAQSPGPAGFLRQLGNAAHALRRHVLVCPGSGGAELSCSLRRHSSCRPGPFSRRPARVARSRLVVPPLAVGQASGGSSGEVRAAKLTSPAASLLPGGAPRYLQILAAQADSQIRLLQACGRSPKTPEEAAAAIADGTAALVDWCAPTLVGLRRGRRRCVPMGFCRSIRPAESLVREARDRPSAGSSELAVKEIVKRGVLIEQAAKDRVAELLSR